ncbi:MAG TPA: heparan-alpha-glucosaminide N-acetyltransferase domain-containing protein, partial [Puia sp.]|nr:heparan-alpha-glucosaminide N-acetyltransferase domain-containing protein [Puia sp.]
MSRIKSLDLARGFTVMMIAPIHTVLLYSRLPVRDTLMGKLMAFIAEGPGAQLFMMLMGVNFAMSRYSANHKSFSAVIRQVGFLLVAGYLLNIAKFVVPHFFGWIPAGMIADLGIYSPQPTPDTCIQLALTGDILQFASIAFLVMYGLSCLPYAEIIASALATLICICSPFAWDLHGANPLSNYLLSLAGGQPPRVFFPLFPWLVYPLVGYAFGRHLAKLKQKAFAFFLVRDLGWILIMTGIFIRLVLRG